MTSCCAPEGPHNAQNACGAAALGLTFGLSADEVVAGIGAVSPAFGRGQTFVVDGRRVVLQLVKNPGGFRQTLRTLETAAPQAVVVAINDDYADGRGRVVAVGRRLHRARRLPGPPLDVRDPRRRHGGTAAATTASRSPTSSRTWRKRSGPR